MVGLTLKQACTIAENSLSKAREIDAAPLAVAVLDSGGHLVAFMREDGAGLMRKDIAVAKAWGVLGMGVPTSEIVEKMAGQMGPLFTAFNAIADGRLVPAAGGLRICDKDGTVLGAVGISGDSSKIDEECAMHGLNAAGLAARGIGGS